jgi:hypothetical protein
LPLAGLEYCHVLDFRLPRVIGTGQLEVADDLAVRHGYQYAAYADIGVEFCGGILGQLKQRAQTAPWSAVGLDLDVMGHQKFFPVSVTSPAAVEVHEVLACGRIFRTCRDREPHTGWSPGERRRYTVTRPLRA